MKVGMYNSNRKNTQNLPLYFVDHQARLAELLDLSCWKEDDGIVDLCSFS